MIIASPFHSLALYTRNMSSGLKIMSSCLVFIPDYLRILYGISNENVSPRGRSLRQISNSRTCIGVETSSTHMSGENARRKFCSAPCSIGECILLVCTSTDFVFIFDLLTSTVIQIYYIQQSRRYCLLTKIESQRCEEGRKPSSKGNWPC